MRLLQRRKKKISLSELPMIFEKSISSSSLKIHVHKWQYHLWMVYYTKLISLVIYLMNTNKEDFSKLYKFQKKKDQECHVRWWSKVPSQKLHWPLQGGKSQEGATKTNQYKYLILCVILFICLNWIVILFDEYHNCLNLCWLTPVDIHVICYRIGPLWRLWRWLFMINAYPWYYWKMYSVQ